MKPFYFSSWLVFDLHLVAFLALQRLPSWQYREYRPRFLPFLVDEGFLKQITWARLEWCSRTFVYIQVHSAIMYDTKVLEVYQRNYYYGNIINKVKIKNLILKLTLDDPRMTLTWSKRRRVIQTWPKWWLWIRGNTCTVVHVAINVAKTFEIGKNLKVNFDFKSFRRYKTFSKIKSGLGDNLCPRLTKIQLSDRL